MFKNMIRTMTGNELSHFNFSKFEDFKSPHKQKPHVNIFKYLEEDLERKSPKAIQNSVSIEIKELKKANSKTGENLEEEFQKNLSGNSKDKRVEVMSVILNSKMDQQR